MYVYLGATLTSMSVSLWLKPTRIDQFKDIRSTISLRYSFHTCISVNANKDYMLYNSPVPTPILVLNYPYILVLLFLLLTSLFFIRSICLFILHTCKVYLF